MVSNFCELVTLTTSRRSAGAEPTGLKRTTIFSWGKPPAAARAAVASRGRVISTVDAVMVKGSSGDGVLSGIGDPGGEASDCRAREG